MFNPTYRITWQIPSSWRSLTTTNGRSRQLFAKLRIPFYYLVQLFDSLRYIFTKRDSTGKIYLMFMKYWVRWYICTESTFSLNCVQKNNNTIHTQRTVTIRVFDVYYPWLPILMLHLTSYYLYRFTNYNKVIINIEQWIIYSALTYSDMYSLEIRPRIMIESQRYVNWNSKREYFVPHLFFPG